MDLDFIHQLIIPAQTKIAMIILDGLGGLAIEPGGRTELETARTPNLDALAESSELGLVGAGCPGHYGGERTGSPWVIRIRSAQIPHRARCAGGGGGRI